MQREVAFLMGGKWDSQDVFSLGVATGEEREGRYTSPRGLESVWSRMWAKRLEQRKVVSHTSRPLVPFPILSTGR